MLHNRHKGGYEREFALPAEAWGCRTGYDVTHYKLNKIAKIAKIRGRTPNLGPNSYALRDEIDRLFIISVYEG